MTHRSFVSPALLGYLAVTVLTSLSHRAEAQVPPPPVPPPAEDPVEPDAAPTASEASSVSEAPPAPAQEPWEQPVAEPAPVTPGASGTDAWNSEEGALTEEERETKAWFRLMSLRRQTTTTGSTGLHRVREAGSGLPGTFRVNIIGNYFSSKGFLCTSVAPCRDPVTGNDLGEDSSHHSAGAVAVSVTPFSFLEAFFSIQNSATSNSNGTPQLLQVVGDTNFGLKGFMPEKPDRIFSAGGELDLYLLSGTGGVGVAGGGASVAMRGLATVNFNNRTKEEDRIPLRLHANLGYFIDNSSAIVRDLEQTPRPEGRGEPIERTERYGLGISRVDALELGIGTEYINKWVRPYLEWTFDIPVNRQKYVCNIQEAGARGDLCLGAEAGFGTTPSRLTLGTRVFPWQASGLSLTGALDLGTGGTKRFLEETTPELPYSLWFALGYAVDVVPPEPKVVPAPYLSMTADSRRYVLGSIVEEKSGAAIPDAIIRYDGVPMTGLVADESGQFISQDLPPGSYTFNVFAEQFRPGTCSVVIPEALPPEQAPPPATPTLEDEYALGGVDASGQSVTSETAEAASAPAKTAPFLDEDGNLLVPLECKLKELPQVAHITGLLVDSVSGGPVSDASVTITDNLNRSLKLAVDDKGSFQFRNVPFGTAQITASAPGYLTTISPVNIESRAELTPHLVMNPRPAKLSLKVGNREITLERPIQFIGQTDSVAIDSMSMVEELAAALSDDESLNDIEIQVHTDDSGSASLSRTLSQKRADNLKNLLVGLGVRKERLTAKGYGPDQPLAPNVSEANRAKNNRVQIMLGKGQ